VKMILITSLERDHLVSILRECASFSEDQDDGWAVAEQCEGGVDILENLETTEVQIPDG